METRYSFSLFGRNNTKYYSFPYHSIDIEGNQEGDDNEVKFEIPLLKTSIKLNLNFGTAKNTYDSECLYVPEDDPEEPDDDYYLYSISDTNLENARFQLLDEDGKLVQEQTTNADGELIFDEVPYGLYKIKQINAPTGLKINEPEMDIDVDRKPNSEWCEYMVEWFNSEEPEVPVEETPEVPTEETPEVPTEETPEVPTEETPEVPTEETPEVPTEETPEVPTQETPKVPVEDAPEIPVKVKSELPTTGMFDVRGLGGAMILSGLLLFKKKRK